MNADRLIVRLAAIAALNNFTEAPYPTLAGNLIFDSRIEPVEDFKHNVAFPVCVVYTDYDRNHWDHFTAQRADRLLTVTFELLIAQVTEHTADGSFVLSHPNTDSELETALDLFELQIQRALQADNPAANCFRHLMFSFENVISRRGATVEGGTKLAARQITVESKVPRGPANGTIAHPVKEFLDRLEQHGDFRDRVPAIRETYTAGAALTHAEQVIHAMGFSDQVAAALAYPRGPVVSFNGPIVFLDQHGAPI